MANNSLKCIVIPSSPLPLLLPEECVAEVVPSAEIEGMTDAKAKWMSGYLVWNNQRIPVMAYEFLVSADQVGNQNRKENGLNPDVVVLNPIPEASRKAYAGLACQGEVSRLEVNTQVEYIGLPEGVDKRYVEAAIEFSGNQYLIPRLASLGVAFTYF